MCFGLAGWHPLVGQPELQYQHLWNLGWHMQPQVHGNRSHHFHRHLQIHSRYALKVRFRPVTKIRGDAHVSFLGTTLEVQVALCHHWFHHPHCFGAFEHHLARHF